MRNLQVMFELLSYATFLSKRNLFGLVSGYPSVRPHDRRANRVRR
jgi:hypothetical protein